MVYSKSEILEAASYTGEIAKINTAYDLIFESAMDSVQESEDADSYTEGVESVIDTLISMVTAIFKAITDFMAKQIDKIDNIVNGKKYQAMMSPEMKAKFDQVAAGKDVKGIDTAKLLKLSKQSEAFINKFVSTVNAEISKAESDSSYNTSHLSSYCSNAEKEYDKIYKEIEHVGTTKISLKKSDFYAMVKAGVDINTNMRSYKKKMNEVEKELKATIKRLNKSGYLKEFAEGDTEFRVYNEGVIDTIKNAVKRVLNSINGFLNKHAKVCYYVCRFFQYVEGLGFGITGGMFAYSVAGSTISMSNAAARLDKEGVKQSTKLTGKLIKSGAPGVAIQGAKYALTKKAASHFKDVMDSQDK